MKAQEDGTNARVSEEVVEYLVGVPLHAARVGDEEKGNSKNGPVGP